MQNNEYNHTLKRIHVFKDNPFFDKIHESYKSSDNKFDLRYELFSFGLLGFVLRTSVYGVCALPNPTNDQNTSVVPKAIQEKRA